MRRAQGRGEAPCEEHLPRATAGRREVDPYQAAVVRRIFERYATSRSFSAVSSELNDAGIPAFSGGRWYPITVRRVLLNEAYIGRTVYRRTKRVRVRAAGARRRTRVIERPEEEHIEIPGATPPIINAALWDRVQAILNDPERTNRRSTAKRRYMLSGRLRCGVCSSAMVGQTLTSKGRSYSYYRCRHTYTRVTGHRCESRYIRADALEQDIWGEMRDVLTYPELVLQEQRRLGATPLDSEAVERIESELASLGKREERLVKLFGYDEVDSKVVRAEFRQLQRQRQLLAEELDALPRVGSALDEEVDEGDLRRACGVMVERLDGAGPEDHALVLEAVQLQITATREELTIEGSLPVDVPESIKNLGKSGQTDREFSSIEQTLA